MTSSSRTRLERLLRGTDPDVAEAALLCAAEADPELDVDVALLRIEALTDDLRTRDFPRSDRLAQAAALTGYLHGSLGFRGATDDYYDPDNSLLHRVLDRRRGLPITLSILYIGVARRLHVPAFGVGLPGHFVAAIEADPRPCIIDPFHGRADVDDAGLAALVRGATGRRGAFRTEWLRPEPVTAIVRRVLANLVRDQFGRGEVGAGLRTWELQHVIAGRPVDDLRQHAEQLIRQGRYLDAAAVLDAYIDRVPAAEAERARAVARRARSKLN